MKYKVQDNKKDNKDNKGNAEKVKYVYATKHSVFIVLDEPRPGKYDNWVPIKPLFGGLRVPKEKKVYDASELRDYEVRLNVRGKPEWAKKGMLVLWGFNDDEFAQITFEDGGE